MSVEIRLDPDTLTVAHFIPDADAVLRSYRIVGLRASPLFGMDLERCDDGNVYHIRELGPGRWACDCADSLYRGRRKKTCKHRDFARALREYLRALRRLAQQGVNDTDPTITSKAAEASPF